MLKGNKERTRPEGTMAVEETSEWLQKQDSLMEIPRRRKGLPTARGICMAGPKHGNGPEVASNKGDPREAGLIGVIP